MSKNTIFAFDSGKVVTAGADGRYRDGFYISDTESGISEAEALRQWIVSEMSRHDESLGYFTAIEPFIDRLVELAEKD